MGGKTFMLMAGGTGGHISLRWRWRIHCARAAIM